MNRLFRRAGAALLALPLAAPAAFAAWPAKPVRVVVPYSAGGAADALARRVTTHLSMRMGLQFVVDNKAGAGGSLGAAEAARAAPDGLALLWDATAYAVNPTLIPKLPFDYARQFAPVTLVAHVPNLLVVPASSPYRTVAQLVEAARARPGQLSYASAGNGTGQHLAGELFAQALKLDLLHVPYKGGAPALNDLAGGQVDLMFSVQTASWPLVRAGKLRALAVTGARRAEALPEVPTVAEAAGPADFRVVEWNAVFAPAGTPPAVVERLANELRAVLAPPEMRGRLAGMGASAVGSTPAELGEFVRRETARWAQPIRAAPITAD